MLQHHVHIILMAEIKVYRYMCGITSLDKIRSLEVCDNADKLQEYGLRWYGQVRRRPPDYVGNPHNNEP